MNKDAVIPPFRFRFTEEKDVERYGKEWFVYDELTIISMPARALLPMEEEIGLPITTIMDGYRQSSVLGDTGAAWLALWAANRYVPWKDFNPCSMLIEWEQVPQEETGKASSGGTTESGSPATVVLPTMPAVA